jgi:hypothetical protein
MGRALDGINGPVVLKSGDKGEDVSKYVFVS